MRFLMVAAACLMLAGCPGERPQVDGPTGTTRERNCIGAWLTAQVLAGTAERRGWWANDAWATFATLGLVWLDLECSDALGPEMTWPLPPIDPPDGVAPLEP